MQHKYLSVFLLSVTTLIATVSHAQDSREISKILPLKANGEVIIDTYKGSITVTTWDKPQIEIRARIEADDNFDTKYAAEKVRDTDVRIDATESRVRIKSDYDDVREHHHDFWSWFGDGSGSLPLVHYTICMPATANLSIKDYKSRSSLKNLSSNLDFNTYKGEVEIVDLRGSLKLETYKGEARVHFNTMKDRSHFETYKGTITVELPKTASFDLDTDFGHRVDFVTDFDVDLPSHGRRHRNLEFHGPINGGGASLVLRSTRGNIRLRQQ
jgi:hypothetical protein